MLRAGVLAAAVYFWQLPHFLSLSWLYKRDYARGGYRMMSLLDTSGRRTAACCLRNSIYLIPIGALGTLLGVTTPIFGFEAALLSGVLATTSATFLQVGFLSWGIALAEIRASLLLAQTTRDLGYPLRCVCMS